MQVSIVYPEESSSVTAHLREHFSALELPELKQLNKKALLDDVAGRLAAKRAVKGAVRGPATRIEYRESGQPFILGDDGHCSISHSYGWGAAAVSSATPMGIDIERVRNHDKALLEYLASDEERALLSGFDQCTDLMTLLWVAKEAVMKAEGIGLINPRLIIIESVASRDENTLLNIRTHAPAFRCTRWDVYAYRIRDAHLGIAIPANSDEHIKFDRNYSTDLRACS